MVQVSDWYYNSVQQAIVNEENFIAAMDAGIASQQEQKAEHQQYLADYQAVLATLEPTVFGS